MPRIPAATIAHLKQSVSVKTLAEQAGVVLKPAGGIKGTQCAGKSRRETRGASP